jgi:hypothetical protein
MAILPPRIYAVFTVFRAIVILNRTIIQHFAQFVKPFFVTFALKTRKIYNLFLKSAHHNDKTPKNTYSLFRFPLEIMLNFFVDMPKETPVLLLPCFPSLDWLGRCSSYDFSQMKNQGI